MKIPRAQQGRWSLTPQHELRYRGEGPDEEIQIKGPVVAAAPEALIFSLTTRQTDHKVLTRLVSLSGAWKVNGKNQIIFEVEKESGKKDILTFKNTWSVGKNHQLLYRYEGTQQRRGVKKLQELVFSGHWDLSEKNHLTYILEGDTQNRLRFRGTLQTPSILAKKGELRYQLGVEVAGKRKIQTVTFFGAWKVSRDFSLQFEIQHPSRTKAVTLTRELFGGDGQAYIHFRKSVVEALVEAGFKLRF